MAEPSDPCNPSPCGPNSQCRNRDGQAVCSCLPTYIGAPPGCRPECVVSSECASNRACTNQKCVDPCPGTCGQNARCEVINHSPICSCRERFTGDPFSRCSPIPRKLKILGESLVVEFIFFFIGGIVGGLVNLVPNFWFDFCSSASSAISSSRR